MTASTVASTVSADPISIGDGGPGRREYPPAAALGATDSDALPDGISMVERVAKVVSGISVIAEARNALDAAGWMTTIAANRITVGEEVLAEFIPAKLGTFGLIGARWEIYSIAGAQPVWIVGAEG